MASDEPGLVLKLKSALRQVGFRKEVRMEDKSEAVLQTETPDGNEPEDTAEDAYYGYQGRDRNYRNQNRGQYQYQGQNQNQGQGQYQYQGQNQNQGQGQARQYNNQSANNERYRPRQGFQQQNPNYNNRQQQQPQGNMALTAGITQLLNNTSPAKQLEMLGMLSKYAKTNEQNIINLNQLYFILLHQ